MTDNDRPETESESIKDMDPETVITENKKHIRKMLRSDPEAYKTFIKQEYEYLYNVKKISKKKANAITVPLLLIMGIAGYEGVNIVMDLKLPSILSMLGL